ncbi:MAG: TIGR03915 family putative DNA repair protein [Coriobacteriales bacterium]|jgi:probable DNA metabolism protein|nr:TIGR03915 family putative DNA repair protein [Coriobacteriales bacterium]
MLENERMNGRKGTRPERAYCKIVPGAPEPNAPVPSEKLSSCLSQSSAASEPNAPVASTEALLGDADLIYLYDGSLEGLLSAVFAAFARKEAPVNLAVKHNLQESLLCSSVFIDTDLVAADRVQAGIKRVLGSDTYEAVKQVFLSKNEHKGGVILRYLRHGFKRGRWFYTQLAHPVVSEFTAVQRVVINEAHYLRQFVRFAQLESGLYFARIQPKASVVPLIMDHFADRFNVQPFIIYDARHQLAGIFDTERWWLTDASQIQTPALSAEEDNFQALWQTFFDTITIEERRNPRCQRSFMPKRFWGNLCEQIPPQLRRRHPQTPTQIVQVLNELH